MKHFLYSTLIAFAVLILNSCANEKPITGGPKDENPPVYKVEESKPGIDNRTNYKGEQIVLVFDERIDIQDPINAFQSTPEIKEYKIKIKKNRIYIDFEEDLDSNTTYTLNFNSTIKDITEKNAVLNVKYFFSTGAYLDSGKVAGVIKNNIDNKELADIFVGLYKFKDDTSTIANTKPRYYTWTKKSLGRFEFDHLKIGEYAICAFEDKNKNMLYDKGEKIAFTNDTIHVDEKNALYNLRIFKPIDSLKVKTIKPLNQYSYEIKTNAYVSDYKINNDSIYTHYYDKKENRIVFYKYPTELDTIYVNVTVIDTLGYAIDTTLKTYTKRISKSNKKSVGAYGLEIFPNDRKLKEDTAIIIKFPIPVVYDSVNTKLMLYNSNDTLKTNLDSLFSFTWNNNKTELSIKIDNKTDSLTIDIPKNKYMNADSSYNNQSTWSIIKADPDSYGILKGTIKTEYTSYWIQLINKKNEVIRQVYSPKQIVLNYLPAGEYSFRVLIDKNNDGIYQTGNYNTREIPEPIYFYPEFINLKSNWEIDDIKISF